MAVCVIKLFYGKGFGAYTVEVGDSVKIVEICGVKNGRYLSPTKYSNNFKEDKCT